MAGAHSQSVEAENESTATRNPSSYRLEEPDGSWWDLGWDPALGTYFAQRVQPITDADVQVLADVGHQSGEITTVDQLAHVIGRDLPNRTQDALVADAASFDGNTDLAELPWGVRTAIHEINQIDSETASEVASRAAAYYNRFAAEPLRVLPADPVADAFFTLRDTANAATRWPDAESYVESLGIDRALAADILTSTITELNPSQIADVCEGLGCSPFDLWGARLARAALPIYPPEQWPRSIQPLDELHRPPATLPQARQVLRDLIDAHATARLTQTTPVPATGFHDSYLLEHIQATSYRRGDIIQLQADGQTHRLDEEATPASATSDYYLTFHQLTEPVTVADLLETGAPPPSDTTAGWDVQPRLAAAAGALRLHQELASGETAGRVELVRFTPLEGNEVWISHDPDANTWEIAHDPRAIYPGQPSDVVAPGPFTDPRPYAAIDDPQDGVVGIDTSDPDPPDLTL